MLTSWYFLFSGQLFQWQIHGSVRVARILARWFQPQDQRWHHSPRGCARRQWRWSNFKVNNTPRAKPSLKIRTASANFWICLSIFRDYKIKNISLGIKLFFQDRKLQLFASVWIKFQHIQLIQTIVIFIFSIDCLIEILF